MDTEDKVVLTWFSPVIVGLSMIALMILVAGITFGYVNLFLYPGHVLLGTGTWITVAFNIYLWMFVGEKKDPVWKS